MRVAAVKIRQGDADVYDDAGLSRHWGNVLRDSKELAVLRMKEPVLLKRLEMEGNTQVVHLVVAPKATANYLKTASRNEFSIVKPNAERLSPEEAASRQRLAAARTKRLSAAGGIALAAVAGYLGLSSYVSSIKSGESGRTAVAVRKTETRVKSEAIANFKDAIAGSEWYRVEHKFDHYNIWMFLHYLQGMYGSKKIPVDAFIPVEKAAKPLNYHPLVVVHAASRYGDDPSFVRIDDDIRTAGSDDARLYLTRLKQSLKKLKDAGQWKAVQDIRNSNIPEEVFANFGKTYMFADYAYNIPISDWRKKLGR